MLDELIQVMKALLEDILLYNNESFLIPLFLIALLFLWMLEKDKKVRVVLLYLVAALGVIFLCPLYAWIGMRIDTDIYYRVLWSLPMGILICYSVVKLMTRFRTVLAKTLIFIMAILMIILNGDLVYTKSLHVKAGNAYHIPQIVIDVADALKLENYRPIAVLPAELLPFLRQYTADIFTPYGRNILEPAWTFQNELYDAMEGDRNAYDVAEVARCARNHQCAFVVLSSQKEMNGSMEEQGYFLFRFVQGYFIYMDYNYYWVFKEQGLLDADVIEAGG
ncbi:hypothetical protein IMSAGC011_00308 [Lachnospiraceae bacterium]|nr:hypothetical protein IMSAGC011_00308 [Lachnospiraceae bacterium]